MTKQEYTFDYVVELKKDTPKYINYIGVLMIIIAFLALVDKLLRHYYATGDYAFMYNKYLAGYVVLLLASIAFNMWKYKKTGKLYLYTSIAVAGLSWLVLPPLQPLLFLHIGAALLEKPIKVKPEYGFDDEGIVFNSFPKKEYCWNEVQNVVIKFGMLSIDLKNNKLIQEEVDSYVDLNLENEFNAFCLAQINKHKTIA